MTNILPQAYAQARMELKRTDAYTNDIVSRFDRRIYYKNVATIMKDMATTEQDSGTTKSVSMFSGDTDAPFEWHMSWLPILVLGLLLIAVSS